MSSGFRFAFFGSSLVSSYWNGSCTYYRGIIRALNRRGHEITFFEPRAYDRQLHRDIDDPEWADVVVYEPEEAAGLVRAAGDFDIVVKTSGVGVNDELLEREVVALEGPERKIFWDVDAPATLTRMEDDPADSFRRELPGFDLVLAYGGGEPVIRRYEELGAQRCIPVYNALDPDTHHPVAAEERFRTDLAFLGNRLPDREERVERFFFDAVEAAPGRSFLLGGNAWDDRATAPNLTYVGHVGTADHNAFNSSPLAVLNITRESMARNGWSPATRVFEAAGAGACLITDAWEGIEDFLVPDEEVLVARDGAEVAAHLESLDPGRARAIGEAGRERILSEHTYEHRGAQVEEILAAAPTGG
jgi:spore maturation protein CgeB